MKRLAFVLVILSGLWSCIDQVSLPIRNEPPQLVVDGLITNEKPPYSVRLSYSGSFAFDQENPQDQKVTDAVVTLNDDAGHSTPMAHDVLNAGFYRTTDAAFVGQPGRSYTLTIRLSNGKTFVSAPEKMPAVPGIDSVYARFTPTESIALPYQYYFYLDATDPSAQKNYYRWTAYAYTARRSTGVPCCLGCPSICYDRCWVSYSSQDINILADNGIDGNRLRQQLVMRTPIYTPGPTLVEVQQYSLTPAAFQFWKLFREQQSRTGTIFDPLPASVIGNISNASHSEEKALGYFGASAVVRKRFRERGDATYGTAIYGYISSVIVPQGDCRQTYGWLSPVTEPTGWQ
ncbi:DUF4249 domain-containing protein [Larkinella humicola]|uniref:DUF4249 domain-containing protein n=1 Tax=Larkinella humicola TaxID=2607654 RepID=A0A5N1JAK6_9BACT|nr:DUF4249 domain-containing protein [Larkinella humicola]KAA9347848.1 DUF4249 domain-containing protein [Larkinella humicola]